MSKSLEEMVARARRVPHRLPERRLCRALSPPSRRRQGREAAKAPGRDRARRGGGALSLQADGLQGRVRGRPALYRRPRSSPQVDERVRRRQPAPHLPSRPAAARRAATRPPASRARSQLRAVDDEGVRGAGEAQGAARHGARSVRLHRRAPHRAATGARLRGAARRGDCAALPRTTTTSPSGSPSSRKRSAASVRSRCATSRPPKPTRRPSSSNSAPGP